MHTYTRNLYKRERVLHGRNVIRSWKKNTENQGLNIYIYRNYPVSFKQCLVTILWLGSVLNIVCSTDACICRSETS